MNKNVPSYTHKGPASEALLAERLFNIGAIKFGSFEVVNSKLSPSPVYIDIRTKDNPKPGPIGVLELKMIAGELFRVINESDVGFDFICGVPNAGGPIADALVELYKPYGIRKLEIKKKARQAGFYPPKKRECSIIRRGVVRVLMVDNAISAGDTNIKAINAVEKAGYIVSGVAVLIDREQGGSGKIVGMGRKFIYWKNLTDLLNFYFSRALIDFSTLTNALNYIETHKD